MAIPRSAPIGWRLAPREIAYILGDTEAKLLFAEGDFIGTAHQVAGEVPANPEVIEAEAQRVDYDGAAEKVRFVGDAKLRVVRPQGPPDEAHAAVITYDQRSDTIVFEGGAPATAGEPGGRVKMIFIPRNTDAPASEPSK